MNKIVFGDCRETMRRWADEGVKAQMCVTSPPYFGLRSYDENAVRIDPSLDADKRERLEAELAKRSGIYDKRQIPDDLQQYFVRAEIGVESRASEYVHNLVTIFARVYAVLDDRATLFVNIGDTYAGFKDGKFPPQSNANGNQRGLPVAGAAHRNKALLQLDGDCL